MQSRPTLSDKIFTKEEEYRLGYSKNQDFLRLKTGSSELIQILLLSTLHLVPASLVLGLLSKVADFLQISEKFRCAFSSITDILVLKNVILRV